MQVRLFFVRAEKLSSFLKITRCKWSWKETHTRLRIQHHKTCMHYYHLRKGSG